MRRILLMIPCFAVLVGCELPFDLPREQRSESPGEPLDPADVQIGEALYGCNRWYTDGGTVPSSDRLIVDVYFNGAADGPATAEQENAIHEHRGEVIYKFDAPVIRADLATSEIPDLIGGPGGLANSARTVPSLDRKDLGIIVMYTRPVQETDLKRIAELGGRVTHIYTVIPGLSAGIPDQSLSALRSETHVSLIELNGVMCLG